MWTPSELKSNARPLAGMAWRVVEHQHTHATRKLVDTQQEQQLLEDILDSSKPKYPESVAHFDYLLKTPFRYLPVNRYGSRFRRAGSREGVFYASAKLPTALAETAYYRIRFFKATTSKQLPRPRAQLTAFTIAYSASAHINLSRPPLNRDAVQWTSQTSYQQTQNLADTARRAEVDLIAFESVRDINRGLNLALMNPSAFQKPGPIDRQTWYFYLSPVEAHFSRAHATGPEDHCTFDRAQFDDMPSIVA
ncbi:MAG: RES family NAD+ phosphorylase [Gammaproteobacteria bacterium]